MRWTDAANSYNRATNTSGSFSDMDEEEKRRRARLMYERYSQGGLANLRANEAAADNLEAARVAEALPTLEKKRVGDIAPEYVQEAQSRLDTTTPETRKLLNKYVNEYGAYAAGGLPIEQRDSVQNQFMSYGAKASEKNLVKKDALENEIKQKANYDTSAFNKAVSDAATVKQFEFDKEHGNPLMTYREEQDYNKATINALSDKERQALYSNDVDTLHSLGWDDGKIKEYRMRHQRVTHEKHADEIKPHYTIDQNDDAFTKAAKTAGNFLGNRLDYGYAATMGLIGALSEQTPDRQGRDLYSRYTEPERKRQRSTQEVQQKVLGEDTFLDNNAVGRFAKEHLTNGQNIGQFLYGALESTGDSAISMAIASATAGALGVSGAGAKVASMAKNGQQASKALKRAATVETLVRNISYTPFAVSGYESAYEQAKERGASERGAQLRGLAGAFAELASEKFSMDHAWDIVQGKTRFGKNILANFLAQGVVEDTEEIASDVYNEIADSIISKAVHDVKSDFDTRVDDYVAQGMTKEEATTRVRKEKLEEYFADGLAGFASGLVFGAGAGVAGYQNAKANERRSGAISSAMENAAGKFTGETEYEQAMRERAEGYKNNPTQYLADTIDDSTVEGKEERANVQAYADRVAGGKKLSTSDRADIERSLAVASAASGGQTKYQQYLRDISEVPNEYKSAPTSVSAEDGRAKMMEAIKAGDVEGVSRAYDAMKNSTSAEARNNADAALEELSGMAQNAGITEEQLEGIKQTPQDAYMAGLRGEEAGALTNKAALAYNAGKQAMLKAQSKAVYSSSEVTTSKGSANLTADGVLDAEGNNLTAADIKGDSAADNAARTALSLPRTTRAAYVENLKDGDHIYDYNYAFKTFANQAANNVEFEKVLNTAGGQKALAEFGEDRLKAFYKAGQDQAFDDSQLKGSGIWHESHKIQKGKGLFDSASRDLAKKYGASQDEVNAAAILAKVMGVDLVVTNKNGKENASFNPSTSTITVNAGQFKQFFHEVGEFIQEYNKEGHDALRKDIHGAMAALLGQKKYTDNYDAYTRAYEAVQGYKSAEEIAQEMTNDILPEIFATDKGIEALTTYLNKNYGEKEAKSKLQQIKDFFEKLKESIRSIVGIGTRNDLQRAMGGKDLEKYVDQAIAALDKAIQNYGAVEGVSTAIDANGKKFSVDVSEVTEEKIKAAEKAGKAVDYENDLIAVHNLSSEQLRQNLLLGGFPSPSIAIIKLGMEHSKYGDTSVVFGKQTIDPTVTKANKIYGGDAYTPSFPTVEYRVSEEVADRIYDKVYSLISKEEERALGYVGVSDRSEIEDEANRMRGDFVDAYKRKNALKLAYIRDKGIKVDIPQKEAVLNNKFTNEEVVAAAKLVTAEEAKRLREEGAYKSFENNPDLAEKFRQALNNNYYEKYAKKEEKFRKLKLWEKNLYEELSFNDWDNLTAAINKYYRDGIQSEIDRYAFEDAVKNAVDQKDFDAWLKELFKGAIEKKGIRNNKGVFTNSGNRRSWESLHDEYNLYNIVKVMNAQNAKGEATFFDQSAIKALSKKDFKSISDVKKNADMLRVETEEEHDARISDYTDRLYEIAKEMHIDGAESAVADALRISKTADGIERTLKSWNIKIGPNTAQKIADLARDISNEPTGYFEAKPRRAVMANEIEHVILPRDADTEVTELLDDMRIPYTTYTDEAERQAAFEAVTSKEAGTRFSLNVADSIYEDEDGKDIDGRSLLGTIELGRLEDEYKKYVDGTKDFEKTASGDIIIPIESVGSTIEKIAIADSGRYGLDVKKIYSLSDSVFDRNLAVSMITRGEKNGRYNQLKEALQSIFDREGVREYSINNNKAVSKSDLRSERTTSFKNNGFGRSFLDRARDDRQGTKHSLAVDSDGFALSDAQQKYFADSKVRDDEGRLKVMYHGSRNAGFTVFDPRFSDDKISLFFTDRPGTAKSYSSTDELYEPDKPLSYEQLEGMVEARTNGDWYTEQDGDDVVIMSYGLDGKEELYRGDLKGAQAYFMDSLQELGGLNQANYRVFLNIKNPIEIDAKGKTWNQLEGLSDDIKERVYTNVKVVDWTDDDQYIVRYTEDGQTHEKKMSDADMTRMFGADNALTIQNSYDGEERVVFVPITTRDWASYAKENGHDGVIIRNVWDLSSFGSDNAPSTVAIAFEPSQIKSVFNENPTENPDIRYSLGVDDFIFSDEFLNANEKTTRDVASILEEGMAALKGADLNKSAIKAVATKLKSEYGSSIGTQKFADMIEKAFAYMKSQDHVDYNDMMRVFTEIARPVVDQAIYKEGQDTYDAFVNALKGYKIALSENQMKEVRGVMGSYADFKKAMAPLDFSLNGTPLDTIWSELVEKTGNILDLDTSDAQQPLDLYDTLAALRPTPVNNFDGNEDEVAYDLAMRIIEEYFGAENTAAVKEAKAKMREANKAYRDKVRNEYRERLKEARAKYKDNRDARIIELKAKNRQRAQKFMETKDARHLRDMISKRAKELSRWIMNPSDKKHVPADMAEPIMEFLNALNFVEPNIQEKNGKYRVKVFNHSFVDAAGKRHLVYDTIEDTSRQKVLDRYYMALGVGLGSQNARRWTDRMAQMQHMLQQVTDGTYFDNREMDNFMQTIDPTLAKQLSDILKENSGSANILQLGSKDLRVINNILRNIKHAVKQGNKAYMQNAEIDALADNTLNVAQQMKERKDHGKFYESLHKLFRLDMATPETFFHLLGQGGQKIYKAIRQGFNTKVADIRQAGEYEKEVTKDFNNSEIKKMTGPSADVHTFNVIDGQISLTTAQIMSLYELRKRDQAVLHFKGGVTPDTILHSDKLGRKFIRQDRAYHLTDSDIERITDTLTDKQKALADSLQQYMAVECAKQGNETAMLMYGYEKFTDPNYFPISTDKSFISVNNSNTATDSLNGIENSGFTKQLVEKASNPIVLKDIFDVFTQHVADMATYHGFAPALKDANRWFNYRTKTDIPGSKEFQSWSAVQKAIDKISGNGGSQYYVKLIKDINGQEKSQYIGNFTDSLISNYKAAAVGGNMRVVIQQPTAYLRAMNVINPKYLAAAALNPFEAHKIAEKMRKESEIAWWKSQGYFETSIGKSMKEIITGQSTVPEKIKNALMAPAGWADDVTWGVLYSAVTKEQKALYGDTLSQEMLDQKIKERMDEVVDQTQVVDSTLHRTQYMRSKDTLNKLQTAFMAEPMKSYNMLMRAVIDDYREGKTIKRTARAFTAFALTNVLVSAAAAMLDALRRHKDDEDWGEVYTNAMEDNIIDNINPLNMIPVLKDVVNSLVNYISGDKSYSSSNRMDMDALTGAVDAASAVMKYAQGESNKTPYGMAMTLARPLSQMTGIPAYNVTRDLVALHNAFFDDLKTTLTSNKYSSVYDAIKSGKDPEKIKEIVDAVMEKGGNIDTLISGIDQRYKSDYFDALSSDPEKAQELAEKAANGLVALGMTDEEADEHINEWADPTYSYSMLDKAIEDGIGIADAVKVLKEVKDEEKMVKHIVDHFDASLEYNEQNGIQSSLADNVNEALKEINGSDFSSSKADLEQKEAEKAAKAQAQEEKNEAKDALVNAVETGGNYKAAVADLAKTGMDAGDIKGTLTSEVVKPAVEKFKAGDKSVITTFRRVATVKAYIDQMNGTKIAKKYRGDYYRYELDQIEKMINK